MLSLFERVLWVGVGARHRGRERCAHHFAPPHTHYTRRKKRKGGGAAAYWDGLEGWKQVAVGDDLLLGAEEGGFAGLEVLDDPGLVVDAGVFLVLCFGCW